MAEIKRDKEDYINLTRSEAQNHYRAQADIVEKEKVKKKQVAVNKVTDFFESRFFSWVYHYFRSRFGKKHKFKNYKSAGSDKGIYKLQGKNEKISIALVSDWATDTRESDTIGELIESYSPDYTIHLGDTYFVGMKDEMRVNFLSPHSSWYRGTSGSFALLGNHEMYSRGISYFRDLLPTLGVYSEGKKKYLGQKTSYFCLENAYWRIIGLDTGYNSVGIPVIEYLFKPKYDLHEDIIDWFEKNVNLKNDKRGLIFLTHHQYCSAFEEEFRKTAEQLASIIGEERVVLWFWGHEHRLCIYGKVKSDKGITAYGRCIGNGGMPVEFKDKIKTDKGKENNLVLYDQRKNTEIKEVEIGYNGFAILKIENEKLSAEYFDIHNELLVKESWVADNQTGNVRGENFEVVNKNLTIFANDISKAIK